MSYAETRRKIDPARGDHLGDGTPNDNDRVEIGPTQLAFGEWASAGLAFSFGARFVNLVNLTMENNPKRSSAMDRHNNQIGIHAHVFKSEAGIELYRKYQLTYQIRTVISY